MEIFHLYFSSFSHFSPFFTFFFSHFSPFLFFFFSAVVIHFFVVIFLFFPIFFFFGILWHNFGCEPSELPQSKTRQFLIFFPQFKALQKHQKKIRFFGNILIFFFFFPNFFPFFFFWPFMNPKPPRPNGFFSFP